MGRTWFVNYKHNLTYIFSVGRILIKNRYALPESAGQSILHQENAVALHQGYQTAVEKTVLA